MYILPEIAEKYPTLAEFAAAVVRNRNEDHCWDNTINENLTAVKADTNKLTWEFKVQKSHCNMLGSLHGGCVATLIDVCSTCTILTYEGTYVYNVICWGISKEWLFGKYDIHRLCLALIGKSKWKTVGVSTDLSISYIRGISPGSVARIECEVQRVGKTMANIYTTIYDERNNLCYTGSHTKFCVDSKM